MADAEIEELTNIKRKLIAKLSKLRDELQKKEKRPRPVKDTALKQLFQQRLKDLHDQKEDTKSNKKLIARSVEVSQSVVGVQFKNVERNWIHDDIFRYNAHVVTKAFQFRLDLNVNMKEDGKYRIEDIHCHFLNLDKCILEEIAPWTLRFTREKDFAHLMFAVSEYSDISVTRAKILGSLEANQYVSIEKCDEEGGGIVAYVHPPSDDEKILFKFQWYSQFVDRTWHVEHIFAIESIQADENFIGANKDLLEGFCKIGLGKSDLEKLWMNLCTAIDTLE